MIRLSKSSISAAERKAVDGVLQREYLGMGDEVGQFEEMLSSFLGRPAIAVCNGTAALHLAIQACGIGHGDEVLVPTLTYVASYQAIAATGAKPVACDIKDNTLMIDCADAEKRITTRTKAIMPVYYTGGVGNITEVEVFAQKHSLRVIADAAHAFGSTYNGRRIGSFGDINCFSFDGIKNITCGEGGCIVTNDQAIIEKVKDARLLGVTKDSDNRYAGKRTWEFDVTEQGWRYHMSNIMAAIGIEQFKRLDSFATTRKYLASLYDKLFADCEDIITIQHDYSTVVPHIYVVRLRTTRSRDEIRRELLERGIQTGIHYQLNHTLTMFHDPAAAPFPVAEKVYPRLISIPLHTDLSEDDVRQVARTLKEIVSLSNTIHQ